MEKRPDTCTGTQVLCKCRDGEGNPMTAFLKKHVTFLLTLLLITLLVLAWLFPSAGLKMGIASLLLTFLLVSWLALEKQKNAYRTWQITRGVFIRNAAVEISGAWIVMTLAGLLGREAAWFATQPIGNDLLRTIAGIVVGLLVGMGVGTLANKTWKQVTNVPPER
jgi:hypothetical protein